MSLKNAKFGTKIVSGLCVVVVLVLVAGGALASSGEPVPDADGSAQTSGGGYHFELSRA